MENELHSDVVPTLSTQVGTYARKTFPRPSGRSEQYVGAELGDFANAPNGPDGLSRGLNRSK